MKKTLTIILVIALLCVLSVGTTLTYFTDTDFDKNVMTVGGVTIEQIEQKRGATAGTFDNLVADSNNVTSLGNLYPYIGAATLDQQGWYDTNKNAVDKIVKVKNTGSEAAYIRTLFAFEVVKFDAANNPINPVAGQIHVNYNQDTTVGEWAPVGSVVVGNVTYYVYSFTYKTSVAGNNTITEPSLKQIALDCNEGNEFSTAVGGSYEILVLSQAVQAQGFNSADEAFAAAFPYGNNNAKVAEWFTDLTTPSTNG